MIKEMLVAFIHNLPGHPFHDYFILIATSLIFLLYFIISVIFWFGSIAMLSEDPLSIVIIFPTIYLYSHFCGYILDLTFVPALCKFIGSQYSHKLSDFILFLPYSAGIIAIILAVVLYVIFMFFVSLHNLILFLLFGQINFSNSNESNHDHVCNNIQNHEKQRYEFEYNLWKYKIKRAKNDSIESE